MVSANKKYLIIGFVAVVVLFFLFGGGMFSNGILGGMGGRGDMMGGRGMFGSDFMWFPTLLFLGVGLLLGWLIWGRK